jgi:hypothetical protein
MSYSADQFTKLKTFWIKNISDSKKQEYSKQIESVGKDSDRVQSIKEGRSCCGGRKLSLNQDLKSSVTFVPRQGFEDWYCSVNWFFLYVQQCTGYVYVNRDCRTSTTTNRVEPLGHLKFQENILRDLQEQLDNKTMPVIKCVKDTCLCGFCAPKAQSREAFDELIRRHVVTDVFSKE